VKRLKNPEGAVSGEKWSSGEEEKKKQGATQKLDFFKRGKEIL